MIGRLPWFRRTPDLSQLLARRNRVVLRLQQEERRAEAERLDRDFSAALRRGELRRAEQMLRGYPR